MCLSDWAERVLLLYGVLSPVFLHGSPQRGWRQGQPNGPKKQLLFQRGRSFSRLLYISFISQGALLRRTSKGVRMKVLLLIHFLWIALATAQTCYNPNGTPATDAFPCDPTGTSKHCCMNNSTCLSNGLCFFEKDSGLNTGFCTAQFWDDESCFQSCLDSNSSMNSLS